MGHTKRLKIIRLTCFWVTHLTHSYHCLWFFLSLDLLCRDLSDDINDVVIKTSMCLWCFILFFLFFSFLIIYEEGEERKSKKISGHIKAPITISPILLENSWRYKFNDLSSSFSNFSNLFCLLLVIFFNIIRFIDIFN